MGKRYYQLLLGIYVLALVICGAARIMLKLRFMNPDTGFYTQNNGIVLIFNIVLLAAVVALFLMNRLRRVTSDYAVHYRSRVAGFFCLLTGVAVIAYALMGDPYPDMEQGYSETLLIARDYIAAGLGVIAGLALIWLGIGGLLDKVSRKAIVPALFPCLWQLYMLVTRFNSYTVLTTISDNLLAVLFMVFAALFLIGQARTIFGLTRKDGCNYTLASGLCASLLGLLLVVPNYIFMLVNDLIMPAPMLGMMESVYALLLSIYALVFVVAMVRTIKQV